MLPGVGGPTKRANVKATAQRNPLTQKPGFSQARKSLILRRGDRRENTAREYQLSGR